MYIIPQYILQSRPIKNLQNTTIPCFMPSYFPFNALWLVYFHLFNFFSSWKYNFLFMPFLFTPTFSGTKLGHKTRSWCIHNYTYV
jgi:hypothetical protein